MKGHSYEKIWLEPLFAIEKRVPQIRVIMSMIADFADGSDDFNPHVSVLLGGSTKGESFRERGGIDNVAASDADFASAAGPLWSSFVLDCKRKVHQMHDGEELLSVNVFEDIDGVHVRGIIARECQLRGILLVILYQECRFTSDASTYNHGDMSTAGRTKSGFQDMPFELMNSIFRAHIGDVERQLSNAFPPRGTVTEIPNPILSPAKTPLPPAPRKERQRRRSNHEDDLTTISTGSSLNFPDSMPVHGTSRVLGEASSPLCNLILPTPEKKIPQFNVDMGTPRPLPE